MNILFQVQLHFAIEQQLIQMQRHKQAYLNQVKTRYARKLRDQGPVGMPKKVAMGIAERNMTQTVLKHNFEQFSFVRYHKYKLQYPRMRESDIVAKIIRQWEAMDMEEKIKLQYQDDACDRDSVWSGDDPKAEEKILERRRRRMKMKKKKIMKKRRRLNSVLNWERIRKFRDSKVRIFVYKGIPDEENFRLEDACAKKPWSRHFTDEVERKYDEMEDEDEERARMEIDKEKEVEKKEKKAEKEEEKKPQKERKTKGLQKWQRRPNKIAWKTKKTCYPCWKDNFNVDKHFCLPKNLVEPYQSISSVVPVAGFISIGRRSSTPVLYDPQTGKTKGTNSTNIEGKENQPSYIFFPVKLPIFLPPNLIRIDYWVQTFSNTCRGLPVRLDVTFPEEFHPTAQKFSLMESDKAIQIQEVVPQYGTSLLKESQKIVFANGFQRGDVFGPIGGQMVPRMMANQSSIPFNRNFSLTPIFGATLLSFTKVDRRKNVKMIGAIEQQNGEAKVYMFFMAMRNIEAFEQIVA